MRGSIRLFAGMLVVMGAVGTLDMDPNASLLVAVGTAAVGLLVMASGVAAMNRR